MVCNILQPWNNKNLAISNTMQIQCGKKWEPLPLSKFFKKFKKKSFFLHSKQYSTAETSAISFQTKFIEHNGIRKFDSKNRWIYILK